jgi:hypothetical protein
VYDGEEAAKGGWSRSALKPRGVGIFENLAMNCGVM